MTLNGPYHLSMSQIKVIFTMPDNITYMLRSSMQSPVALAPDQLQEVRARKDDVIFPARKISAVCLPVRACTVLAVSEAKIELKVFQPHNSLCMWAERPFLMLFDAFETQYFWRDLGLQV